VLSIPEISLQLHLETRSANSLTTHHRLRGSASPVNGDWFCQWERANFEPHRIDTPQPITKQIVTGDYVGDPYACAKLGAYPSTGGFWAYG